MKTKSDILNHQAYNDVFEVKDPQSTDKKYLECYYFWRSIVGEKHFDLHYEVSL